MSSSPNIPPPADPLPPVPGPPRKGLSDPQSGGIGRPGIKAASERRLRFGLAALTIPTKKSGPVTA